MRFVWDERKNRRNRAEHGVGFETAILVFDDPSAVTQFDRTEEGEERWHTLGLVGGTVVLIVAHTYRQERGEEIIRIISARKATRRERKIYEEGF